MFQDANHLAMRVLETSVEKYECAGVEMKWMCSVKFIKTVSLWLFGT
jgi:hypothetical protein